MKQYHGAEKIMQARCLFHVKAWICVAVVMLAGMSVQAGEYGEHGAKEPDAELLEFLADWETDDGQWVEPSSLENLKPEDVSRDKRESTPMQVTQEKQDEH